MLRNIFLCLFICVNWVNTNPLYQLFSGQGFPLPTCHQNNPQQFNRPVEQPVIPSPCSQAEPVNRCQCPNNRVTGITSDAQAQLVNRILSNPLLQSLMKQNVRCPPPEAACNKPSVINNYFIIPTEALLKESEIKAQDKVKVKGSTKPERKANESQRQVKVKNKSNKVSDEVKQRKNVTRGKELPAPPKIGKPVDITTIQKKVCSQIPSPQELYKEFYEYNCDEFNKDQSKRSEGAAKEENLPPKTNPINPENNNQAINHQNHAQNSNFMNGNNQAGNPVAFNNPKHLQQNAPNYNAFNPIDQNILQDIKRKYPDMSDQVVQDILVHMKQQLKNEMPKQFYPHHPNHFNQRPMWYPPNHPYHSRNQTGIFYGNGQSKMNRPMNRKMKRPNSNKTLGNLKVPNKNTTDSVTKTDITNKTVVFETSEINNIKSESHNLNTEINIKPDENTTHLNEHSWYDSNPQQIDTGNDVPNVADNGIWEDYYPTFTKDNLPYSLYEEFYDFPEYNDEEIQRNERRIIHPDQEYKINRRKQFLRKFSKDNRHFFKLFQDSRSKGDTNVNTEEVVYRTPPGLESPDFQTYQVNAGYDSEFDRPGFYELDYPVFNAMEVPEDENNTDNSLLTVGSSTKKPESDSVETNSANSKVNKYGNTKFDENIEDEPNELFNDGEAVIVVAKSYPDYVL